jgi:hypothetical protein
LTAVFCFVHSRHLVSRTLRLEEVLVGVMLLVLGPASLAAYLVRARTVWVSLDSDGLIVSGRRTIPWEEIRDVTRRRPLLRKDSGPAQVPAFDADQVTGNAGGCVDFGCLAGVGELFIGVLLIVALAFAVWVVFFVFVPLVIITVLEVFIPFGDLIKIRTGKRTLVLRDLSDADEFMSTVGAHVRVSAD